MTHAICNLSIVPLRTEPSHRSELGSQLLFGEHFEIIEAKDEWLRTRAAYDGYEGWILKSQCAIISYDEFNLLNKEEICISYDLVQIVIHENSMSSIVIGSSLPHYKEQHCLISDMPYKFEGNVKFPERMQSSNTVIENSYMYLNCPYMWGGRSPFGIDCSGFMQMVFKLSGIKLRRDAWQQAEQGSTVNLHGEALPGDLAFFDNAEGKISHVGIILAKGMIIHASGKVRIDALDQVGIYNNDLKKYTHNLRLIKRLI